MRSPRISSTHFQSSFLPKTSLLESQTPANHQAPGNIPQNPDMEHKQKAILNPYCKTVSHSLSSISSKSVAKITPSIKERTACIGVGFRQNKMVGIPKRLSSFFFGILASEPDKRSKTGISVSKIYSTIYLQPSLFFLEENPKKFASGKYVSVTERFDLSMFAVSAVTMSGVCTAL